MTPSDNIFPSKNTILNIIKTIPLEVNEDEDDDDVTEMEDDEVFSDLELLSDLAASEPYTGEMELLSDDDDNSNISMSYQQLLCMEDMETINSETPPGRSNANEVFEESGARRRLFWDMTSSSPSSRSLSSTSSSDEYDFTDECYYF